jgi:hypothetical protein
MQKRAKDYLVHPLPVLAIRGELLQAKYHEARDAVAEGGKVSQDPVMNSRLLLKRPARGFTIHLTLKNPILSAIRTEVGLGHPAD